MKFPMGVFQIRNISNNKYLIDHSVDMESKWNRHRMELKFGNHRNKNLQSDWNKYGEANFVFEVLSELRDNENSDINYKKELKILHELVIEENNIDNRY